MQCGSPDELHPTHIEGVHPAGCDHGHDNHHHAFHPHQMTQAAVSLFFSAHAQSALITSAIALVSNQCRCSFHSVPGPINR